MPPTLVLIRHAQAHHNVDRKYHSMPDPELTETGIQECLELREHLKATLPADRKIELIVVSPMRRTIQTCLTALDWLIEAGVPVIPDARWQETQAKPCDTGSPVSVLTTEFPTIDFSSLDPVYPDKTSPAGAAYRWSKPAILARGQSALADLYQRSEDVIAVVSHSGFMRTAVAGRWFQNADYRIFDFEDRTGKDESEPYRLVEWEVTKKNGAMGRSREEPVELGEGLPEEN
ncbi:hypothetical protein VTJ49DRAFT_7745 [Mycothermus thermophilus]|uniref:Phosphoglycerate mutase-like protein n=1 Tax=Humicola insolens TaxID=85995 RepID=A0ABR3VGR5_HUMIN